MKSTKVRDQRHALVMDIVESLTREVPQDVLLRKIMTEGRYSLSGAEKILKEAMIFAEAPKK